MNVVKGCLATLGVAAWIALVVAAIHAVDVASAARVSTGATSRPTATGMPGKTLSRICVVKYWDKNGNGKQDAGEPQLSGWHFKVFKGNVQVGTLVSGPVLGKGHTCLNLPPGIYKLHELLHPGWVPTKPVAGTTTVVLHVGQTLIVRFGNRKAQGKLCVVKFWDKNGNGKQDAGEPYLSNWKFTVKQGSTQVGQLFSAASPGKGHDCRTLDVGTYTVVETIQNGWAPTSPASGSKTAVVLANQTTIVKFGNRKAQGKLCVVKFWDKNGDGKQDAGEPYLPNWQFKVTTGSTQVATLVSAADPGKGHDCVTLDVGTYTVTETVQSGWVPTVPASGSQNVTVVANQTKVLSFGNRRQQGRLCVVKYWDKNSNGTKDANEPYLPDWQFPVKDSSGTQLGTLVSGSTAEVQSSCQSLDIGSYTVAEVAQAGWEPTAPSSGSQSVSLSANQTTVASFGNRKTTITSTFTACRKDGWSVADGATAEPVNPVPPTPANAELYCDGTKINRSFSHRFTIGSLDDRCIKAAKIVIGLKDLGPGSNDTIGFHVGTTGWGHSLNPGPGWGPAVPLDLSSLTNDQNPVSNLVPALDSARVLDVFVQDDTSVDYIELSVTAGQC